MRTVNYDDYNTVNYDNYNIAYSVKSKPRFKITQEQFNDLYKPFSDFITETEFKRLLNELKKDRQKTGGLAIDLLLCVFIKHGFTQKHLSLLSKSLGHKHYRAGYLRTRLSKLKEIIVFLDNNND